MRCLIGHVMFVYDDIMRAIAWQIAHKNIPGRWLT